MKIVSSWLLALAVGWWLLVIGEACGASRAVTNVGVVLAGAAIGFLRAEKERGES